MPRAYRSSSWNSSTAVINWHAVKCRCRMPHCLPQHTRKSCPLSIIRRLLMSGSYYQQHPKRGQHGKPTTHYRAANIARDRLLTLNPLAFGAANHVTDMSIDTATITMALDKIANAATNDSSLIATLRKGSRHSNSKHVSPQTLAKERVTLPQRIQPRMLFHTCLVSTR